MKRIAVIIITLTVIIKLFIFPAGALDVSAKSAILIEADGGRIIFEKDANTKRPEASTTKIMTALVALENYSPEEIATVSGQAASSGGTSIYLKEGDKIKVEDLLYGMLLESGNDAAEALAEHIGKTRVNFVNMMNDKAKAIGLCNTQFRNPSGLPDDEHYTTAYELALITRKALQNPIFARIVSTKSIKVPMVDGSGYRYFKNHNSMLNNYDGADGVKTGFTTKAGRCLVSSATRDGVKLIAVTLDDKNDWRDHKAMLDLGFSAVKKVVYKKTWEDKYQLSVGNGKDNTLFISNVTDIEFNVINNDMACEKQVLLPQYVFAPVKKGKIIGEVRYIKDGNIMCSTPLCAESDIEVLEGETSYYKIFFDNFSAILYSVLPL